MREVTCAAQLLAVLPDLADLSRALEYEPQMQPPLKYLSVEDISNNSWATISPTYRDIGNWAVHNRREKRAIAQSQTVRYSIQR